MTNAKIAEIVKRHIYKIVAYYPVSYDEYHVFDKWNNYIIDELWELMEKELERFDIELYRLAELNTYVPFIAKRSTKNNVSGTIWVCYGLAEGRVTYRLEVCFEGKRKED